MKPKLFFIIGSSLLLVGICIFLCAINHPTLTVPLPRGVVTGICKGYICLTAATFSAALVLKLLQTLKHKNEAPCKKASDLVFIIGSFLLLIGICYFLYAINHPTLTVPLPSGMVTGIYKGYICLTAATFSTALVLKFLQISRRKKETPDKKAQA